MERYNYLPYIVVLLMLASRFLMLVPSNILQKTLGTEMQHPVVMHRQNAWTLWGFLRPV